MPIPLINIIKNKSANTRVLILNILGAFLIKGMSLAISLLTVPAFISYFNDNTYLGIWYTVLSFVLWFLTFDLGIGNGIRNSLVSYLVKKDYEGARIIISSGLAVSFIFGLFICFLGYFIIINVDWNSFFSISNTIVRTEVLMKVVLILYTTIVIRLIFVSVSSIFYALQLSSINNFIALISASGVFVFIKIFHYDTPEEALIQISYAYLWIYSLPVILAGVVLFLTKLKNVVPHYRYIAKETLKKLTSVGGVFFYCQILFTIITNSDQFIITKFFGADYTVDYTFYHRLTSIIGMIIALCMTPLWSMITKARVEKNYLWLYKLYKILEKIAFGIILIEFLFIPLLQPIMNLWLRQNTITVSYAIAISFAIYGALFIMNNIFATFACGLNMMRVQCIWYSIGIFFKIISVALGYWFEFNWSIVIWGDVLALGPYIIIQVRTLNKFFKGIYIENLNER